MLAAAAVVAASATPAAAQGTLPDNNAGTGQYVEPVPTAGGNRPASPAPDHGTGSAPAGTRGALPAGTRHALPPGEEGRVLGRLATDPGSGAPTGRGDGARGGSQAVTGGRGRAVPSEESTGAASAVVSAALDSGGPGILILGVGVLVLTLTVAGVRRRS
jgi:hypothetical protein